MLHRFKVASCCLGGLLGPLTPKARGAPSRCHRLRNTDSNGPVCTPAETLNCGALSPSPRSSRQGAGGAVMSIPTWVRSSFVSDMLD